jgi:hypothetical protein
MGIPRSHSVAKHQRGSPGLKSALIGWSESDALLLAVQ